MSKRPLTRVQEIREKRGLRKAELARLARMPPQTLQQIEDGKTKGLSVSARRLLAPQLQVSEHQLLMPVGFPIDPLPGEEAPVNDLIYKVCCEILDELRAMRELLQKIVDRMAD